MSETGDRDRRHPWWIWLLVLAALAPMCIGPGDIPWTTDEPRLIAQAWHYNEAGHPATFGLSGNFGVPYGPVPTQIYQMLLLFTWDMEAIVVLRGLLCAGATLFSLLWLARTLRLPAWFAPAIMVAPYISAYSRILWDASFTIPLGTLALASFASVVAGGGAWALRTCLVCTALVPVIHPQGLPFGIALGGWLLWKRRPQIAADWRALSVIAIGMLALHAAYIPRFYGALMWRFGGESGVTYPGTGDRAMSLLSPFLGGRLLSAFETFTPIELPGVPIWLITALRWASLVVYPLGWLGIAFAAAALLKRLRAKEAVSPVEEVAAVLAGAAVLQMALFAVLRIPPAPQYMFTSFPMLAFFAWYGMARARLLPLGAVYGLASLVITSASMATIHANGFPNTGWIKMRDAIATARTLNSHPNAEAFTNIPILKHSPQILRTQRLVNPPADAQPASTPAPSRVFITRDAPGGTVLVKPLPDSEPLPTSATPVDVTPLPRDWVPDPSTW